ncbi:MAG: M6 family metalloprotease domain-containing protein [Fibrobacterota bacterium]
MSGTVLSAPHVNDRFELLQPDGSRMPVIVNGDEFYQRIEDLNGRTLVRDEEGWISYAALNTDSTEFVPGMRYTDTALPVPPNADLHLRLRDSEVLRRVKQRQAELNGKSRVQRFNGKTRKEVVGEKKGLTLLIDFSDEPAAVSHEYLEELINGDNFGTYGSVSEYFYDISGGKLDYKNVVTQYIRVSRPKSYYDDPNTSRARELIGEALDTLYYRGFDFSQLTMSGNDIVAINTFYAGEPDHGWSKGLWPHKSSYLGWTSPDGQIGSGPYQITNVGSRPTIGTFCHENGHMLLGQPDLYPYSGDNNWVGRLCLMGSGMGSNPAPMNPWFRYKNGWVELTNLTDVETGTFTIEAHDMDNTFYYQSSHDDNQYYFFVNVQKNGRWSQHARGSGMKVWRVNLSQDATNTQSELNNPRAAILGYPYNSYMSNRPDIAFSANTTPAARWHNNVASNIELRNLSSSGQTMTFDIGTGATLYDLGLTAENGSVETDPEGSSFKEDSEVQLTAQPDYGYEFSHWSGDLSGSDNPQTLVMDGNKNITANFEAATTYSLDITAQKGSVSIHPDYPEYIAGEEIELRVHPDTGYVFSGWEGDITSDEKSVTLVIDGDKSIQAGFTPHGYTPMDVSQLSVASFSSEDDYMEGRPAINVLDEDNSTVWFTQWEEPAEKHPHEIVLEIGADVTVGGLRYTPRQDSENGRISEYEVYVSADGQDWGDPVTTGFFTNSVEPQDAAYLPSRNDVSYIRLVALSEVNGEVWTSIADLDVLHNSKVSVFTTKGTVAPPALHGSLVQISQKEPLSIRISGINGRLLKSMTTEGPQTIDLSRMGFSSGVYVLQIQSASGTAMLTSQFYLK